MQSCEVQGVAKKFKPVTFLLLMRGLRFQIILVLGTNFLCSELIIGHLNEKYDVFSVQHGHENFQEKFLLDLTHLQGFRYQYDILSDIKVNFVRHFFSFINVVEEHYKYVSLGGIWEFDFDLRIPVLFIW